VEKTLETREVQIRETIYFLGGLFFFPGGANPGNSGIFGIFEEIREILGFGF